MTTGAVTVRHLHRATAPVTDAPPLKHGTVTIDPDEIEAIYHRNVCTTLVIRGATIRGEGSRSRDTLWVTLRPDQAPDWAQHFATENTP